MGWLEKLTTWLKEQLVAFFSAIGELFHDLGVWLFESVCDLTVWIVDNIGVPSFMTEYSFQGLFDAMGPTAGWILTTFRIGECFAILGVGMIFRLLRKLLTLGQW